MVDRPASVWLVCWMVILSNFYFLVKTLQQLKSDAFQAWLNSFPFSYEIAEARLFLMLGLCIVLGIFMYEGKNWARWVFLGLFAINLVVDFLHLGNPAALVHEDRDFYIHLGFFVLALPCLFHPEANRFFCPPTYDLSR